MGPDEFAAILISLGFIIACTVCGAAGWYLRGGHDAAKRIEAAMRIAERRPRPPRPGPFPPRNEGPGHTIEMSRIR